MAEGRTWMYRRKSKKTGELNPDFCDGVQTFCEFAFTVAQDIGQSMVKCPCKKCRNIKYFDRSTIEKHLLRYGFKEDYYVWDLHGEQPRINHIIYPGYNHYDEPSSSDNTSSTRNEQSINQENQVMGCDQMIRDALFPSTSFEHENIGNEDDMEHDMEAEIPNEHAQKFYQLLKDAAAPLYQGCTEHTRLSALTEMLSLKSQHNISDAAFKDILKFVNKVLPNKEALPSNMYRSKRTIKDLGLPYHKIHACENNCMLFYGNDSDELFCKVCGACRYTDESMNHGGNTKLKARKVLRYLPITERLQRIFMSSKTAEFMTFHARLNENSNGSIGHPSQSEAWKHVDNIYPDFAQDVRNVRLGLCTDGFNPMADTGNPYSMWPVFITVYNMPPNLCMKEAYIFMVLLIPGPRSPGRNIDVFLRPLIEELKVLWNTGVTTWDAHQQQNFLMRACLLWTISDFPAYGMLSGWSTHGNLACPYCLDGVTGYRLPNGHKPCWWGCHRRFLPPDHQFRNDRKSWGRILGQDRRGHSEPLSGHLLLRQIERIQFPRFGIPWDNERAIDFGRTHNWIKKSIFWELSYWVNLIVRHNLDVMHIEKNCFENVFYTVMNVKGKSKDNANSRLDLHRINIRPELHLISGSNGKPYQPKASYTLDAEQIANVCYWLRHTVKLPDGYASNIDSCVNTSNNSFYSMKSHDCHVFMQKLLPIVLRDAVLDPIWIAIAEFSKFFRIACAKEFRLSDIQKLQDFIAVTLCKLEKYFPPSFFDSMEHLTIHLPWELKMCGPVQFRWMYPFERLMKKLKEKCVNKQFPEVSIVEKYRVQEVSIFSEHYFIDNLGTRINPHVRNDVGSTTFDRCGPSIFKHPVKNIGKPRNRILTDKELHQVHTYILLNSPEVQPYISQFDELSRNHFPHLIGHQMDTYRLEHFAQWFCSAAYSDPIIWELTCFPDSKAKSYRGSFVNGFRFHTYIYGQQRRTSNWGICVLGDINDEDYMDFYGWIDEILELQYTEHLITVFKGTWFNPRKGVRMHAKSGIVDVDYKSRLDYEDPFILASQAQQVVYIPYPPDRRNLSQWWTVFKSKPRNFIEPEREVLHIDDQSASSSSSTTQEPNQDVLQEPIIIETIVISGDDDDEITTLVNRNVEPEMLEENYQGVIDNDDDDDNDIPIEL